MTIKEELTHDFQSLIKETDKVSFNQAKLKLYEKVFINFPEDNVYVIMTAFEMACDDFINKGCSDKVKNVLINDFQMLLIILDVIESEK